MKLDLRLPIGLMFTIVGVLLTGFGLISDAAIYQRSLGDQRESVVGAGAARVRRGDADAGAAGTTFALSRPVEAYTLRNAHGLELRALTRGATITALTAPDRDGRLGNIVLGHDTLDGYLTDTAYLGAVVGRYANRIAGARFTLDGREYRLAANDGPNHLHGGRAGFDQVLWRARPFRTARSTGLALSYRSPDGEEGYPGNLDVRVRYALTDQDELVVDFRATADAPTPVNLTQHSYFNLGGGADILDHLLWIHADEMTPVDETLIPTGALAPVAGTPFDFSTLTRIGDRIEADDVQLRRAHGYDHNFVLKRARGGLVHAARLVDPSSGRTLDVHTTEPGLQFYSGNFLKGAHRPRSGLCLETQHFPDSPNQPRFPSTILRPGATYRSRTIFAFSITSLSP